jgi:hypothetical protein
MTPSALTPAARKTSRKAPATHRSQLRQGIAPWTARRLSGPLGGLTRERATTTRKPVAAPRRRPARPVGSVAAPPGASLAARVAASIRALPDHSLLDRIIRGRVWIPLVGVLLAGIVAMQVEVLKLNAATGLSLQESTALQSQRDLLQASVARLADDQRIESMAYQMGMVMPAPSQVKFLSTGPGNTGLAVGNIHQPNAAAFAAQLPGAQTTGGVSSGSSTVSPAAVPAAAVTPTLGAGTAAGTATGTATGAATGAAAGTATGAAAGTATGAAAGTATGTASGTSTSSTTAPSTTTVAPGGAATGGVSTTPAGG